MPKHLVRARTAPVRKTIFTIRGKPLRGLKPARQQGAKLRTKLRTKTKLNQKIPTSKDGPVSDSYFTHKLRGIRLGKLKRLSANQNYSINKGLRMTWLSGQQSGNILIPWYLSNDLVSCFLADNLNNPIPGGLPVTNQLTRKLFMDHMSGEVLISNVTNDVIKCKLYDVAIRRDSSNSSYDDPWSCFTQGLVDSGNFSSSIIGTTPFSVPAFTQMYKILKITDVDIHSGGHHRHKVYIQPKKVISEQVLANIGVVGSKPLGKWTYFTMVICHGYPVNTVDGTGVSTASGGIDMVQTRNYSYYSLQTNRTFVNNDNNLSLLATEQLMNDLIGSTQPLATA